MPHLLSLRPLPCIIRVRDVLLLSSQSTNLFRAEARSALASTPHAPHPTQIEIRFHNFIYILHHRIKSLYLNRLKPFKIDLNLFRTASNPFNPLKLSSCGASGPCRALHLLALRVLGHVAVRHARRLLGPHLLKLLEVGPEPQPPCEPSEKSNMAHISIEIDHINIRHIKL